ncbi:MAG: TRAP transporter small permease [Verrucomicrobia bacterium]|nr:TRAP transporter small permease [Verrucomicrobiota bacterium]MDA1065230.1 TRAP transporter small permease [Verrucomicrobiota bacterium]
MKLFHQLKSIKYDILFLQFSIVALLVLSVLQVFTRYVLNAPLSWTEEISTMILIWMTYVGAYTLLYRDSHARVDLIDDLFGQRIARWVHTFWDFVIGVFLVAMAYAGVTLMEVIVYDKTPALRISYAIVLCIIPVVAVLMLFTIVRRIYRTIFNLAGGR